MPNERTIRISTVVAGALWALALTLIAGGIAGLAFGHPVASNACFATSIAATGAACCATINAMLRRQTRRLIDIIELRGDVASRVRNLG